MRTVRGCPVIEHRIRQTGLVVATLVAIVGGSCAVSAAELAVPAGGKAAGAIPTVTERKAPPVAMRRSAPVRITSVAPRLRPVVRAPVRQYAYLERPRASFASFGFMALGIGF